MMAETQRTLAALLTILADNTTGQISPEDVRDIVETLRAGHAELSLSSSAETSIATVDTFVKAAGTTTLSANAHNWTMPQDNRLTYGGTVARVVHVACSLSMTAAANNKLARLAIAKNGTIVTASEVQRFIATGADVGSTALHSMVSVDPTDYLEVWIANGTDNANMTLTYLNLFVMDMAI